MTKLLSLVALASSALSASAFTAAPKAFRRTTLPLHMSLLTTSPDEWELPDEIPEEHNKPKGQSSGPTEDVDTGRLQLDDDSRTFATGDKLHFLRQEVLNLRSELENVRKQGDSQRILELQRAIISAQEMDAEFVYSVNLEAMESAEAKGRLEEAEEHKIAAMKARDALPQFNLQGLWVGKYGENGYELINITYAGDTLYAHKVTGDQNVPKGELTFKVDLNPLKEALEPIELGEPASRQWGTKFLSRYSGKGQVAGEGYTNPQFLEGQLILVNEFFSFAWIPIGHQVFFGRPSPELTIRLMRQSAEGTTEIDKQRSMLNRCLEETEMLEEDHDAPLSQQEYYNQQGCFE